ncbi:hypothetical protein CDL12_10802 [Handroanthus impetiginosus]|uniref:Uncharacterized protein n=1 Tax=Handroanthus impetiginosus TaxID=429701 RepID=A0A2G9HGA6_9LAMI|nr:hypothetical protein CDL12_10802 [Handroanthus impetiginosus]
MIMHLEFSVLRNERKQGIYGMHRRAWGGRILLENDVHGQKELILKSVFQWCISLTRWEAAFIRIWRSSLSSFSG